MIKYPVTCIQAPKLASQDKKTLLTSSYDGSVVAFDLSTMALQTKFPRAHSEPVLALAASPANCNVFVTCGQDGIAAVWDLREKLPNACQSGKLNYARLADLDTVDLPLLQFKCALNSGHFSVYQNWILLHKQPPSTMSL